MSNQRVCHICLNSFLIDKFTPPEKRNLCAPCGAFLLRSAATEIPTPAGKELIEAEVLIRWIENGK